MEALTGASVAALTIYDMCKAVCKNMIIGDIKLVQKTGLVSNSNVKCTQVTNVWYSDTFFNHFTWGT